MASPSWRPHSRVTSLCGGSMTNLNVLAPDMALSSRLSGDYGDQIGEPQSEADAATAHRWVPSVLPRRRRLGGGGDGGVAAADERRPFSANPLRPIELACARDAVRLRDGSGRWVPAHGNPQLDRPRSGRGAPVGDACIAVAARAF